MNRIIPLTENHLFSKAYSAGASDVNKLTAVYAMRNFKKDNEGKLLPTKLGITVNKKLGGAVQRNRVKRIIRQAYRDVSDNLSAGKIIVVSARGAVFSGSVKSTDVASCLKLSFDRLGLYNGQEFVAKSMQKKQGGNGKPQNAGRRNAPKGKAPSHTKK